MYHDEPLCRGWRGQASKTGRNVGASSACDVPRPRGCVPAVATGEVSATRGGRTVMAVILGAASGVERAAKARVLIDEGFKARGGRSVDQLTGAAGKPPADGYCKRNTRPEAEELMAAFAKKSRSSSILSFARGDLNSGGIRRSIVAAPAKIFFAAFLYFLVCHPKFCSPEYLPPEICHLISVFP